MSDCYCNSRNALDVLPAHTAFYFPKLYQLMRYLMFSELISAWGQTVCKEELSRIVCIKYEHHGERMDQKIIICKSFVSPPVISVKRKSNPNGPLQLWHLPIHKMNHIPNMSHLWSSIERIKSGNNSKPVLKMEKNIVLRMGHK